MTLIDRQTFLALWTNMLKYFPDGAGGSMRGHGSPMQDPDELWHLLGRIEANGPLRTILEVGVCEGGGLKVWEMILPQTKDSLLVGVDWNPNPLWYTADRIRHPDVNPLPDGITDLPASPVTLKLVKGNTHDESTRAAVKLALGGRQVDFLFIDAQHHAAEVERDLVDYGGFVRDNGIIAFHDTRLFRSFWDRFTGGGEDSTGKNPHIENAVFHKEEIKLAFGTGIFWKLPNQTVVKFREV